MSYIGNTTTTQAFTPAVDYFSGNGSTTAFTLSRPVASVAQVEAVIDNVVQNPSSAYTVSGSTITFTSAPLAGTNNIYVRYTSPITQVIAPSAGTVGSSQLASLSTIPTTGGNITVPAVTGTMMVSGNMPAFLVYKSTTQAISNATWTKITFNSQIFDTASAFDRTTNYRFQPLVAGYYQLNATMGISGATSGASPQAAISLYRNGSIYIQGNNIANTGINLLTVSSVIYLNGSTDYVELYGYLSGSTLTIAGGDVTTTCFSGALVRSA